MQPIITIFCSFTRAWAVDGWLENLAGVKHDPSLTNLCFIVDCNQHLIANTLKKFAEARGYRSFHLKVNEDWQPNEVRLAVRRMRIADVKNQSKDLVVDCDGDIVIGFEDDTVFERLDSFEPLYQPLIDDETLGYIEGVQIGRWGANMIGAWEADKISKPREVKTLLPDKGRQVISAGGFYGYGTRKKLYLNAEYYTSSAQPWGPDVNFGFYVWQQGYKCMVDWRVIFGHRDFNKILYPDDPKIRLAQIVYNKNVDTGKWDRTDHEPSNY